MRRNLTAPTRRSHREGGAAAVEFALVVPILLALIVGIVEFGMAWNYRTQLNNATMIAARDYAINRNQTTSRAMITGLAPGATVTFSITCNDANSGQPVTVTATTTRATITQMIRPNFTYRARGIARCN